MTIGTGIFLSTILVLIALGVYRISKAGMWRIVGKWVAGAVFLCVLAAVGLWGWNEYQGRPQAVDSLDGVRLGMSQLDLKLAKGKAEELLDDHGKPANMWLYKPSQNSSTALTVHFTGDNPEDLRVAIVCEEGGYSKLLGLGRFNSEADVVGKLGTPSSSSIHAGGLNKMISYSAYKVAYHIEKGAVKEVCITSTGKLAFTEEYGKASQAAPSK